MTTLNWSGKKDKDTEIYLEWSEKRKIIARGKKTCSDDLLYSQIHIISFGDIFREIIYSDQGTTNV